MRLKVALLCSSVVFLPGSSPPSDGLNRTISSSFAVEPYRQEIQRLRRARDYAGIRLMAERGAEVASKFGDLRSKAWFLNAKGSAEFSQFQYQEAIRSYLAAQRLAQETHGWELYAAISMNLSSLYLQQHDLPSARHAAREGARTLERGSNGARLALARAQAAAVEAQIGDWEAAERLFRSALQEAELGSDAETVATILDQFGYRLLERGRKEAAEDALLEAYRLRKLSHSPELASSYYTLGLLRLAQGQPATACGLLDKALAGARQGRMALPVWRLYYERGRARGAGGNLDGALEDYAASIESIRRLRLQMLPAESVWTAASIDQYKAYEAYIETSVALFERTGRQSYLREALAAWAESQAASLHALVHAPEEWRRRLPERYWSLLAELRDAEAGLRAVDTEALQAELTGFEVEAGLELTASESFWGRRGAGVSRLQALLGTDTALIAVQLNEPRSYRWALTGGTFEFAAIRGREALGPVAANFHKAVVEDSPSAERLGETLYRELFGGLSDSVHAKRRWLLNLDGRLLEAPLAALVTGRGAGRPEYLVERHSLQVVPTPSLLETGRWEGGDGFVGVGDPVFHPADPRWRQVDRPKGRSLAGVPLSLPTLVPRPAGTLSLPRLPGSGREVAACAKAWTGGRPHAVVLTGSKATVGEFQRALASGPEVVHLATHFVASRTEPKQALAALAAVDGGVPELLSPAEIARWRYQMGTVVLSGCGSAVADVLPAEGLMGMTRAWMAAGARSVVASLWPVRDDDGTLFQVFYRRLSSMPAAAGSRAADEALRAAQVEMLRSGGWRAEPRYWAAYFAVGRE